MKLDRQSLMRSLTLLAAFGASLLPWQTGLAQEVPPQPEYPPFEKVTEGFVKADSKSPDKLSLCGIWTREKDGQMLLELPKDFATKKYFIALTVSSGDRFAGLQSNDFYVYWRQYNKRLALIVPNMNIRSNGEPESKSSVKRLFTDTVLLDVPIVAMGPRGGGPVIDADALFVGNSLCNTVYRNSCHHRDNISNIIFGNQNTIAFRIFFPLFLSNC